MYCITYHEECPRRLLMIHKQKTRLYFAPHQDDELLTMGIDICSSVQKGDDVHVILCTDGSKSNVRKTLNNGKHCSKHEGSHIYELSAEEFTAARDREFTDSCRALGVADANIHIPKERSIDGSLTPEAAGTIISHYLSLYGKDAVVCTIAPNNGPDQHRDHKALGKAAENLLNSGKLTEVHFFIEPYHAEKVLNNPRLLPIYPFSQKATASVEECLKKAIQSYSYWNPKKQRYAVGYHSVTTEFNDFLKEMTSHYFIKKPWSAMTAADKLSYRYRRHLKLQKQAQLFYSMTECPQPKLGNLMLISVENKEDYRTFCQKYNVKLREKDFQRLSDGSSFWCLVNEEQTVVSTGWLVYGSQFYIGETDYGFDMSHSSSGILFDFNTKSEHRGNGYYGLLLQSIVHQAEKPSRFIIYTAPDNTASAKGIQKAGFHFDGTLSAADHTLKPYLKSAGFSSIMRKNRFFGMKVSKP